MKLWALLGGTGAAFLLIFHLATTAQQRSSLDDLLVKWKRDYHLNEEQARTIRKMEEEFHGSGNPFFRPAHDARETREHHRAMAGVMSDEDGARFFRAQEGSALPRQ